MRSTKLGEPNVDALKEGRRELRHDLLGVRFCSENSERTGVTGAKKKKNECQKCDII